MTRNRWSSRYSIVAIRTEDLGTGSVRSVDIKNGAVGRTDIAASSLGRAPALWGRIESIGETFTINRGGLVSVDQLSTGRYTIQAGRDITACTYQVTPRTSGVSAGADQASNTALNVYIDDVNSGNPFQADFDIAFFC